MTAPDQRAFEADAAKAAFRLGQAEGRWCLISVTWPFAYIAVTAKDGRAYTLRLNCQGYPQVAPTGGPWDCARNAMLAFDLWPRGLGGRVSVRFDGRHFGALWDLCKARGLTVVADVHVHPGGAQQSDSDQAYPMISRAGHVALILPRFATGRLPRRDIGIFRYLGAKRWSDVPVSERRQFFHIGM